MRAGAGSDQNRIAYVIRLPKNFPNSARIRSQRLARRPSQLTKALQAIAAETTDYSKKSFEKSRVLAEKLIGVKKIDEAIQLQSDFAKSAYEDFVAQATKIGSLYSDLAKDAFNLTKFASACGVAGCGSPRRKRRLRVKQS